MYTDFNGNKITETHNSVNNEDEDDVPVEEKFCTNDFLN